ncbi:MAG: MBL fold metallo-hydrolase [Acidobacteria bacterium]|nr:MBL fold metallo-hydrolase [Acidobacteriota bacterium]
MCGRERLSSATTAACAIAMLGVLTAARPAGQDALLQAANQRSAVQVYPVRGNVYLLVSPAGPNVTVHTGDEGVLVVDTGPAAHAEDVLGAIRRLSRLPIRYVINTTHRDDHVGGNAVIAAAGRGFEGVASLGAAARATGIAHENVLKRLSGLGEASASPAAAWPTLAFHTRKKEIHLNGEPIHVLHQPAAHADGDSLVFFRSSDVVSAGDVFLTTTYPVIDTARGGSLDGVIAALNALIDITTTRKNQEGGTLVIPGHGRVSDEADVVEYRDMLAIVRGRVQHYVAQGMTLAEIQRARPTMDYDGRYGAATGPASPQEFVEIVHRGVVDAAKRAGS